MKSIYTYYDYRQYLREFYEEKKARNPIYSFRYIAGKVAIDHALIVKIMQGTRHISDKKIDTLADFLGLGDRKKAYFKLLVAFSKAKRDVDSRHYFEKILNFSEIASRRIDAEQYEFYQHWYYTAVREVLNIKQFKDDYQWLADAVYPAITVAKAKKAVALLERLGMIKRDAEGFYHLTEQFITTGTNWQSIAIRTFQKEGCFLAATSLDTVPKEFRDISSVTLTLNEEGFCRMKELLEKYRDDMIKIAASCQTVDRVYQMNLQLFPLTKIKLPIRKAE